MQNFYKTQSSTKNLMKGGGGNLLPAFEFFFRRTSTSFHK